MALPPLPAAARAAAAAAAAAAEGGKEGEKNDFGSIVSSSTATAAAAAAAAEGGKEGDRASTSQWNEVGFQGKDPATDFRGMGLLGLIQLVYFAETYPEKARALLLESEHPRRWFPWAVTGVNVTSFVVELLVEERVLDGRLVEVKEEGGREGGREGGMKVVHEVYCQVWEEVGRAWVEADAENVMAFPKVWSEVRRRERRRWRRRRGDDGVAVLVQ